MSEPVGEMAKIDRSATVRVYIFDDEDNVLLLQKGGESKASGMWEVPGGGGSEFAVGEPSSEQKVQVLKSEIDQEAVMKVPVGEIQELGKYTYPFKYGGLPHERDVYVFKAKVNAVKPPVLVGSYVDENGRGDNHVDYNWVSLEELRQMKESHQLLGNTDKFEDFFES